MNFLITAQADRIKTLSRIVRPFEFSFEIIWVVTVPKAPRGGNLKIKSSNFKYIKSGVF